MTFSQRPPVLQPPLSPLDSSMWFVQPPSRHSNDLKNPVIDSETWGSSWYLEKASTEVVKTTLEGKPDGTFIVRDHPHNDDEFILNYRYIPYHGIFLYPSGSTSTRTLHSLCLWRAASASRPPTGHSHASSTWSISTRMLFTLFLPLTSQIIGLRRPCVSAHAGLRSHRRSKTELCLKEDVITAWVSQELASNGSDSWSFGVQRLCRRRAVVR
jgi:hypothetical protein